MDQSSSFVDSARLGIIILTVFALVWAVAAVGLSSTPTALTLVIAAVLVITAITVNVVAAARHFAAVDESTSPLPAHRRRTIFIAANIAQAVLFSVLISVCIALNHLAYIPLIGSVIVGAHLIPIGLSFAERTFIAGGAMLMLTGVAGIVASATPLITPAFASGVVSLTNAAVLIGLAALQIRLHGTRLPAAHAEGEVQNT